MNLPRFRKPRINLIVGKKHIIIAGLSLLLGLAVLANLAIDSDKPVKPDKGKATNSELPANNENSGNYGDAQFVSGGEPANDDVSKFFAQARLSKRESRDEAKEFLQAMVSGGDARSEEIQAITYEAATLGGYIESESRVEAVLKAQGFSEVLCYISDKGTNIIVRTDGLTPQGAAKIRDALLSEVDVAVEDITIVEVA